MSKFSPAVDYSIEKNTSIGVLLTNLGTPAHPTYFSVYRFLRQFLSDSRVVELPRWLWWPILYGIILPTRPLKSAKAYRCVWTDEGSPLLVISQRQTASLREKLKCDGDLNITVALGMRYGEPSLAKALATLQEHNAQKIVLLPLYPQYAAATTASTFDEVARILQRWRWLPELRTVNQYSEERLYITALANSLKRHWARHGRAEKLLFSFHGLPQHCADLGDPYPHQCVATAQALANTLQLDQNDWLLTYQSRLGRAQWLQPYTDKTLMELASNGVQSVDVICPGFSADCLETLEEIALANKALFLSQGGKAFHYIPALNDNACHINCLAGIVLRTVKDWD